MRSIMPAASRRFRASITVERAMPAALAIVSREGSQRPEATLWKWKRRIRRTCRPVRFRHPPCLWGSRVLASIRSARKISRARCSRVSGRYFTGSSVEPRRCRRFGLKSVFASAYRLQTASFASGVFAAFRSSLRSFQNSKLGCLSGWGRLVGLITRSIAAAICSTIGTTLLWHAEACSEERGTGKTPPWLETSVFHLRRGGRFGRISGAKRLIGLPSHCPPPWGLWCFWGSSLLVAPPKNSADTVPQKLPALKCFRANKISGRTLRSVRMIPPYLLRQPRSPCSPIPAPLALFPGWLARGSAPPVAAAFGRGLTSAACAGAAIGRSAPRNDLLPIPPRNRGKKERGAFHIVFV